MSYSTLWFYGAMISHHLQSARYWRRRAVISRRLKDYVSVEQCKRWGMEEIQTAQRYRREFCELWRGMELGVIPAGFRWPS